MKKRNSTNGSSLEFSIDFPEFSKEERHQLCLDSTNHPISSPCAEYFHREIEKAIGLSAIASNVHASQQIYLTLWILKNETADLLLQGKEFINIEVENDSLAKHPAKEIIDCLRRTGQEFGFIIPEYSLSSPKKFPFSFKKTFIPPKWNISIILFENFICDRILYETNDAVRRMLQNSFRSYDVFCQCGPLKEDFPNAHWFIFHTDEDIQRAKEENALSQMLDYAYDIVASRDLGGHIPREKYPTVVTSKEHITSEQIFGLSR